MTFCTSTPNDCESLTRPYQDLEAQASVDGEKESEDREKINYLVVGGVGD